MINFDDYVNENKSEHTKNWPYTPDEIRQGRVALYMKSGREELYSIYLMYFVNSIRFG